MSDSAHTTQSAKEQSSANGLVPTAIQTRVGFYAAVPLNGPRFDSCSHVSALDSELYAIDKALADLRQRRNSFIRASACPPEVLSSIFRFLAHIEPNYYPDPDDYLAVVTHKYPPRLGWIKAIQVCHSWRVAACTDSTLWATVTTSLGVEFAMNMLRLSKNAPLSLDLHLVISELRDETISDTKILLPMVEDHTQRLSRLQILCNNEGAGRELSHLLKTPAPQLQSLKIFVRGRLCGLGHDVFAKQMPPLRELYLHNVTLPLESFSGMHLTRLNLTNDADTFEYMNVLKVIEALSALPELESLCIKNQWTDTIIDVPADDTPPINCPHLTDITLHPHYVAAAMLIFSRLSHHPGARVSLAGDCRDLANLPFLERFQEHMTNHPICTSVQTVEWRSFGSARTPILGRQDRVGAVHERTLVLSGWRQDKPDYLLADFEDEDYDMPPRPDVRLILGCRSSASSKKDPEDILPWPQPFSSARNVSLQMSERYAFAVSDWDALFGSFPHLEFFRVDRQLAEDFLQQANTGLAEELPHSLRTLALFGIPFGCSEEDNSPDRCLANLWRELRESGGALAKVIVSELVLEDAELDSCVEEAGVVMSSVKRPDWLVEGHEDWDDRTAW